MPVPAAKGLWLSPAASAAAAGTVAAAVYIATMCRTYGPIDKGELAAVATTLGIAHPTGYPTLTLAGHLATRVSPLRPVLTLNILAALLTAGGVAITALVIADLLSVTRRLDTPEDTRSRKERRSRPRGTASPEMPAGTVVLGPVERAFLAASAALVMGFTTTWWSQATGFEVYALHALFLPLVSWLFLRYLDAAREGRPHAWRGFAFALSLGLSFTNHMSTIMLAPAFIFLYFRTLGWNAASLQGIVWLILPFLVGLLPYAYLPLRASMSPRLNWGNPSTLEGFLAHVSGAQFHFAMFYAPRVFSQQTAYFFHTLLTDWLHVGVGLALVGLVELARRSGRLAIWVGLLFATCVGLSGVYDINDIGNYHLTAVFGMGIALAFGLAALRRWIGSLAALSVGLLLAGLNGAMHFREMDESENFLVEDLTHNMLEGLPRNAIVISNDWDYWTSGALYAQEVEGLRRDVAVLDPESLRSEWYIESLEQHQPDLVAPVKAEVQALREQLHNFEKKQHRLGSAEADAYFRSYYAFIDALVGRHNPARAVFVTEHVDRRIAAGWQRLPQGILYRLTNDAGYQQLPLPRYRFRPWSGRVDPYAAKISELYTMGLLARARHEESHGHAARAHAFGLYALSFRPSFREEDVPDFPLHIDDQIREVLRNYSKLEDRVSQDTRGH